MPCSRVSSDSVALGPSTALQSNSGVRGRLAQSGEIWGRWYLVWHWFCRTARWGGAAMAIPITNDMMILWRMPGEVPASGHVAPGRDCMRALCGTAPPASDGFGAGHHPYVSSTFGFHLAVDRLHMRLLAEASRRRYAMSRPRLSRHSFGGELSAPVENRSISRQSQGVMGSGSSAAARWETR
jgi:hypothetical protein